MDDAVVYARDTDYGGTFTYSVPEINADDATAWLNNIWSDPVLLFRDPMSEGLATSNWWYPCECSGVWNAGVVVDDTIGAHVDSLYPGYGWDTLVYYDGAPDIGAYQKPAEADPDPVPDRYDTKPDPRPVID